MKVITALGRWRSDTVQCNKPIKTPNKCLQPTQKGGKKRVPVSRNIGFRFTSDWMRKWARFLNKSQGVAMKNNCEQLYWLQKYFISFPHVENQPWALYTCSSYTSSEITSDFRNKQLPNPTWLVKTGQLVTITWTETPSLTNGRHLEKVSYR